MPPAGCPATCNLSSLSTWQAGDLAPIPCHLWACLPMLEPSLGSLCLGALGTADLLKPGKLLKDPFDAHGREWSPPFSGGGQEGHWGSERVDPSQPEVAPKSKVGDPQLLQVPPISLGCRA